MPIVMDNTLNLIRSTSTGGGSRADKAKHIAEGIRKLGEYRWVGIYDVGADEASLLAWTGAERPEFSEFTLSEGLASAAIKEQRAVIAGDVRNDAGRRTAFASSVSQMIVPVFWPGGGVIGTVNVESDRAHAFTDRDATMVGTCIEAALPLWLVR
jgi:putative methionine-R-sulfoxide reductase with GAF domain